MLYDSTWDRNGLDYLALKNQWHVVARAEDLNADKPRPMRLLGEELVLWRDGSGQVHAWKDYCGHRGARLSLGAVRQGELECPYHGWRFDANGRCTRVPAHPDQAPPPSDRLVFRHHATEHHGLIWVSLGEPGRPLPVFPEWSDGTFRKVFAGPYVYRSNALRAVENFLDASHFPFVHAHLNGDPQAPEALQDYQVVKDEHGLPHWDDAGFRKVHAGPYHYKANALRCLDNFMDAAHFPHVHPGVNGRGDQPDTTIHYSVIEKENELQTTEFTVVHRHPHPGARHPAEDHHPQRDGMPTERPARCVPH